MSWCRKRINKGKPYTFHVFVFFSPKQFASKERYEDKDFLFKIKVCTNSGRAYSGPFIDEVVGEYELTNKELKKMLEVVNETPDLIMCGEEYTIYDDYNGLWKYYGREEDKQLAWPCSPMAETSDLKSLQCGFESHSGHEQ